MGASIGPAQPSEPTFNPVSYPTLTHLQKRNRRTRTEAKLETKTKAISLTETRVGKTIFQLSPAIATPHQPTKTKLWRILYNENTHQRIHLHAPLAAIFAHFLSYKYFPCNSFPRVFPTWIPLCSTGNCNSYNVNNNTADGTGATLLPTNFWPKAVHRQSKLRSGVFVF